ncbi:MAG: penicillin acylase family protein [Vicinamibacterales bacterium]
MKRILLATVVLLLLTGTAGWWWARGSLPALDGQLPLAGLRAPVEVLIDQHGVPTAYARDADDAWFAAGALHARDRLWQMELYRRVTLGRLSEVMGESTLAIDQRFLTLGLRRAAAEEWARATPAVRDALERYAAGVNAVVSTLSGRRRPIEFQLLGISPAPWTPEDSLAVGRLLAWRLAENHQAELVRGAVAAKLGETAARELAGRYPAEGPSILGGALPQEAALAPPTPTLPEGPRPTSRGAASPTEARRAEASWPPGLEWLRPGVKRGNSNSWVVTGRKTASGRPILANDPHLPIEFPAVWYEMHLVAAGLDVTGVTVPGVPFVVLGHNARVGWGITNTNADVQDLVLERIDVGRKRAWHRGEWVPIEVTPADIPIRGHDQPYPFEVWTTANGPVFAEAGLDWDAPPSWLSPAGRAADERTAYSIRWSAGSDLAASFEAFNRAADWASFVAAVELFAAPSSNLVYADVDGNIGYAMSGRLPLRESGDGSMPLDGTGSGGRWIGTVAPSTLPRALNPSAGFISSANNDVDRRFPGLITRDWAAPFRATRLQQVLSQPGSVELDGMLALQNDRRSLAADAVLAGIEGALATGRANATDGSAVAVLERLATWDRVVDARPVVSLYQAFEDAMWRRTFIDEMDEPLFDAFYEWAGAERFAGLHVVLENRQSAWFDDITTVDRRESRDEIMLLAARDADERLQADYGGDSRRAWDQIHAARFDHPLGAAAFPLAWFFNRGPSPIAGDGTTVMRVSWNRRAPFAAWEYPSWRQLLHAGQWDDSRVSMPSGQSGHPLSPHYFDQNETWRSGGYRLQPFSRAAVQAASRHRLLLVP